MANETYIFKEQAEEIIDEKEMKIWLTKKQGKRIEYLFKLGKEQFDPPQKIAESKEYILFGQNINRDQNGKLKELFMKYIQG
ncbi:hypothetical protein [Sporohalobacter salinus]|uniref:hypothetical protein n=1 Tax=Sporohalobacter salinus TaxID=1494606 RepID=UPI00195F9802|nr:hypothetical protein [Sporohalobacter salinus]MBM7624182.1 RNase P subunit RPR2 [Sporohalobacter salinus]